MYAFNSNITFYVYYKLINKLLNSVLFAKNTKNLNLTTSCKLKNIIISTELLITCYHKLILK